MEEERIQKAYAGVIDYFRGQIMAGELKAGERIPPEREIAALLGVSRNSVRDGDHFFSTGLRKLHYL